MNWFWNLIDRLLLTKQEREDERAALRESELQNEAYLEQLADAEKRACSSGCRGGEARKGCPVHDPMVKR